jgi:EAL domain-containing protein (putative c-di-GMP-specific phosphodiesterase class I)
MINLCENLGLDCVVEGIETLKPKEILRRGNCRYMQGYLFAKPMSADRVPGFIAEMARGAVERNATPGEAALRAG